MFCQFVCLSISNKSFIILVFIIFFNKELNNKFDMFFISENVFWFFLLLYFFIIHLLLLIIKKYELKLIEFDYFLNNQKKHVLKYFLIISDYCNYFNYNWNWLFWLFQL